MTLHWVDIALMVAMALAGGAASYFLLLGRLQRMLAENQRETERRLARLTEAIRSRGAIFEEPATDTSAEPEIEAEPVPVSAAVEMTEPETQDEEEIPPQIQAAIAAAAIASLGNHARVRSARKVPSSDVVSPWTQQGRVIVQSSHNLRTQGSR